MTAARAALAAMLLLGCGDSVALICDLEQSCEPTAPAAQKRRDACLADMRASAAVAAAYGCAGPHDDYLACYAQQGICVAQPGSALRRYLPQRCAHSRDALDACQSAASAYGQLHFSLRRAATQ